MTRTGWSRSPLDQWHHSRVRTCCSIQPRDVIRLPAVQLAQRTEGPGTSTPPNRRPGPLDGAIRHPQPPRSPPAEFSVGLGPGNGSTCRRPARALDNAIRPPVPRPRLEMSHRSLRRKPLDPCIFRRWSGRSDLPPTSAAALGTRRRTPHDHPPDTRNRQISNPICSTSPERPTGHCRRPYNRTAIEHVFDTSLINPRLSPPNRGDLVADTPLV